MWRVQVGHLIDSDLGDWWVLTMELSVASDWIVAQNSAQFGSSYPSPNCGKSITISYNGVTGVATIADECPSCGYGDLDMSRGLFDHFAVSLSQEEL